MHGFYAVFSFFLTKTIPYAMLYARLRYCKSLCQRPPIRSECIELLYDVMAINDPASSMIFRYQHGERFQVDVLLEIHNITRCFRPILKEEDGSDTQKHTASQIQRVYDDVAMLIERLLADEPESTKKHSIKMSEMFFQSPSLYSRSPTAPYFRWLFHSLLRK